MFITLQKFFQWNFYFHIIEWNIRKNPTIFKVAFLLWGQAMMFLIWFSSARTMFTAIFIRSGEILKPVFSLFLHFFLWFALLFSLRGKNPHTNIIHFTTGKLLIRGFRMIWSLFLWDCLSFIICGCRKKVKISWRLCFPSKILHSSCDLGKKKVS